MIAMILACPSCDGRYDVSGYPVGQQFRCRCGTVTTLVAPSSEAGLLDCPRCGAGVAPTAKSCAHCSAELLLKACPRCLSRVFHGHKHCPECGAEVDRAAAGEARAEAACPRCERPLAGRLVGDIVIDECAECHGVFLDQIAVQRVVTDRRQARADALLGALVRTEVRPMVPGRRVYVKCPTCQTMMNRKQFASGAGIIVDVCKLHGTFFDAGELPRIIEFVMQGGLEAAERADLGRMRDQAKRELQQAQSAQRDAARMGGGGGAGGGWEVPSNSGGAVIELFLALFR